MKNFGTVDLKSLIDLSARDRLILRILGYFGVSNIILIGAFWLADYTRTLPAGNFAAWLVVGLGWLLSVIVFGVLIFRLVERAVE